MHGRFCYRSGPTNSTGLYLSYGKVKLERSIGKTRTGVGKKQSAPLLDAEGLTVQMHILTTSGA